MDEETSNLSTFDIYSDLLIEKQEPRVSVEQLEKKNAENEAKLKELTEHLQSLQSQNVAILEENEVLKTNISQLFKTAQAELKRKNRQLEDLTQRRPNYWREWEHRSSINDRLRDLRKTAGAHACSNGLDHRSSREMRSPGRRSPEASHGRKSLGEKEKSTKSHTSLSCHQGRNETPSAMAPERNACEKNSTDQCSYHLDMQSEGTCIKDANDQSSPLTDMCREENEQTESENLPTKQHLHKYRIPKKSSTSGTSSHHQRERAECGTSPKVSTSKKLTGDKSTRECCSSSRSERNRYADRAHCSRSPLHGHSNERSTSRERTSRHTERGASRSSEVHVPGRKRRRSATYNSVSDHEPCEGAHRKRHRKEPSSGTRKKECDEDVSQRSKNQKLKALSDHKASSGVVLKGDHGSEILGCNAAHANEKHGRKRHESSRKNKSVKRARKLLHKMHSTPKKHKLHKEDDKKHKRRKRHSSTKHRSKEGIEDICEKHGQVLNDNGNLNMDSSWRSTISGNFEDGEIPDWEGEIGGHQTVSALVNDEHRRKWYKSDQTNKSVKRAKEILHKMHGSPMKHKRHKDKDEKHRYKLRSKKTGDIDTKHEQKHEDNGSLNLDSVSQNTSPRTLEEGEIPICLDVISQEHATEPHLPDKDNHEKVEKDTAERDLEQIMTQKTSGVLETAMDTSMKDGSQILQSSHIKSSSTCKEPLLEEDEGNIICKEETKLTANSQIKIIVSKQTSPLKQPDTAMYGYSSEHETVLICGPSSQEEDSDSETDSRSTSCLSSSLCGPTVPSNETVRNWLRDEVNAEATLRKECHTIGLSVNDGTLQNELSTSSIQLEVLPQAESNSKLCQTQKGLDTEVKQPDTTSTFDSHPSASFSECALKLLPSPVKNTTDSFSEKIREVFGSNSFLGSEDPENGNNMQVSFQSADKSSLLHETSNPCLESKNSYKDFKQSSPLNQSISQTISEVTQNVPKGNSVVHGDDLKRCQESPLSSSQTGLDDPKHEARESSFSEAEKHEINPQEEKLSLNPEAKRVGLAETVFEIFGSNSFLEDENHVSVAAETFPVLVPEQPTLHSEEATFGSLERPHALDKCETNELSFILSGADNGKPDLRGENMDLNSDMKTITRPGDEESVSDIRDGSEDGCTSAVVQGLTDQNPAEEIICKNVRHLTDPPTLQRTDETAVESGVQLSESVIEDVAEVSLHLPSCDTLSCSASPAHSSFMEDSEDSHQSGKVDKSCLEDLKTNDAKFDSDQDVTSPISDKLMNDIPSKITNLSDGEIVSSDSEAAPTCTSSKSKHRTNKRHKEANHANGKSLKKRSRSTEETKRSHKEETHSTRQDRDRHGKDLDRSKFFQEKLRILEKRRKERSELDRNPLGHHGSRPRSDHYECPAVKRRRVESAIQRVGDEWKSVKHAEHRDRHRMSRDDRRWEGRLAENTGSSSRHDAARHGIRVRKHDSEDKRRDRRQEHRR